MRCYFCFAEGDVPRLSKEHLLSQPVANAFGVDRSAHIGHVDPASGTVRLARLDDAAVRFVCERCNNTWMNDLEHDFASLASWVRSSDVPLSSSQLQALQAWSLKTYLVLSVMVGNSRQFVEDPAGPGVIPSFTRARQLYEEDSAAFEGMAFGLARPHRPVGFSYAFGNPRVVPEAPNTRTERAREPPPSPLERSSCGPLIPRSFTQPRCDFLTVLPTRGRVLGTTHFVACHLCRASMRSSWTTETTTSPS